ncbi:cysteine-rich repeat secretory protein 38 [Phtheirospermum japonicum]|uniref:Cysteine-rich repeat secretory protein 38 n=1 Tax=Phtheirospermum japonicum TaxID=374723 RepID=A0A830CAE4_9LAMI|nr:cysteine-rich repeat secretory protein 38 [Phtheirospermum japonicum]
MFISSSVFWQSLLISSLVLIIPIAFSIIEDSYLAHNCLSSTRGEFTPGSAYEQSRLHLVDNLCANAPNKTGFWNASWAEVPNERAYGLALCRGDVSPEDCETCLTNATITVVNTYCPNSRGAIIWHDYCQLKYSDVDFLGQIDVDNHFSLISNDYEYDAGFIESVVGFLSSLSETATFGGPATFFAEGTFLVNGTTELYGMVQCTRDLSVADCKTCLYHALNDLFTWTFRAGALVFHGSCNVRYET